MTTRNKSTYEIEGVYRILSVQHTVSTQNKKLLICQVADTKANATIHLVEPEKEHLEMIKKWAVVYLRAKYCEFDGKNRFIVESINQPLLQSSPAYLIPRDWWQDTEHADLMLKLMEKLDYPPLDNFLRQFLDDHDQCRQLIQVHLPTGSAAGENYLPPCDRIRQFFNIYHEGVDAKFRSLILCALLLYGLDPSYRCAHTESAITFGACTLEYLAPELKILDTQDPIIAKLLRQLLTFNPASPSPSHDHPHFYAFRLCLEAGTFPPKFPEVSALATL